MFLSALPNLLLITALTLAISLLVQIPLRPLLRKWGVLDVANARSSHSGTVLRGLGLGVWVASLAGAAAAWLLGFFTSAQVAAWLSVPGLVLLPAVAMLLLSPTLGLLEDLRGLSIGARSVAQLLIAVAVAVPAFFLADLPVIARLLLFVFGILFVSSFINVANFMDGLNGISSLHGLIAGAAFFIIGAISSTLWLMAAGLILAASFAGFLPWNLKGYGFLGDVGSYLLGSGIITISWLALLSGVPLLAAIGPTVVYFGDVGWTLIRRYRRGEKLGEAHKEHVYQRLHQSGMSHLKASLIVAGCSAAASILGILTMWFTGPIAFVCLLILGFLIVVCYVNLPRHARVASVTKSVQR
ncbi:UDP-phosphate alpha-N-acetyl-D-fucosaminephosphotransferase [Canibacter zhoujuaniae]|uniref:UDP-phosphate alpha-N-acetyl-D-fucosaminephosphotransferase n=1 Tax=Canibacter zhoujuaniae TaxID=2708343 RepID=UPI001422F4B7|nr:UDP-phosphate alpha-N-acetyl-D-fucosaminephosphotransferase [Canibacter zhoujuaniae]